VIARQTRRSTEKERREHAGAHRGAEYPRPQAYSPEQKTDYHHCEQHVGDHEPNASVQLLDRLLTPDGLLPFRQFNRIEYGLGSLEHVGSVAARAAAITAMPITPYGANVDAANIVVRWWLSCGAGMLRSALVGDDERISDLP
jgi:hypothetical protein